MVPPPIDYCLYFDIITKQHEKKLKNLILLIMKTQQAQGQYYCVPATSILTIITLIYYFLDIFRLNNLIRNLM